MTAILHHGLKNCFVLNFHLLSISYFDFYFTFLVGILLLFSTWIYISLFSMDFFNLFSFFVNFFFQLFFNFSSILFELFFHTLFLFNRGEILDFFQIFIHNFCSKKYFQIFCKAIFFFQVETKKNCYRNCCPLWQQIEPHLNSWLYPSINHPR